MGNLLNLLGRTLLRASLAVLAPAEHEPGNKTDDGERAHDGADGDTSSGTLGQTAAATGGALLSLSIILVIGAGLRSRFRGHKLVGRDVEAWYLDVKVRRLNKGLGRNEGQNVPDYFP